MKALALKELREVSGIAAAALVGYLALVVSLMGAKVFHWVPGMPSGTHGVPFSGGEFANFFAWVSILFAVALGFRQSAWESARGTFLFLLHRPVSRRAIFLTKLAIGVGILLVCASLPIVLYGWWAAVPGHHPSPFAWSMTRPAWQLALSDAARVPGRFPERPATGPLVRHALAAAGRLGRIRGPAREPAVVVCQLPPGGVAVRPSGGQYLFRGAGKGLRIDGAKPVMMTKGLFQPLVLAGVLATGFLVVWGVVAVWALQSYLADECQSGKSLLFQADGTPFVVQHDYRYGESQYWDLQGNPVPPPDQENPAMMINPSLPASLTDRANVDDTDWKQRIRSFSDGGSPAACWQFVSDGQPNGSGYFVGYDSKSCGCVGYMGTAGFRTDVLPTEEFIPCGHATAQQLRREDVLTIQFDANPMALPYGYALPTEGRAPRGYVSPCDVYVVGHDHRIYHADLQKRTVHVALEDPRLCSAALVLGVTDPVQGTPHRLVARIEDAVLVLDDRGQILKRYPIPESLRSMEIHFAETTAGEALMLWTSPFDELATEVDYRIYWVTPNGRFRQTEITLPSSGELPALRMFGARGGACPARTWRFPRDVRAVVTPRRGH